MQIRELVWAEDRVEHIARHGVQPEDVEEVCFGESLVLRAKASGKNPVYYVLGETSGGATSFAWSSASQGAGAIPSPRGR